MLTEYHVEWLIASMSLLRNHVYNHVLLLVSPEIQVLPVIAAGHLGLMRDTFLLFSQIWTGLQPLTGVLVLLDSAIILISRKTHFDTDLSLINAECVLLLRSL